MTQRQRENLARYLYDLSKIVFATAVAGNLLAWKQLNVVTLLIGGTVGGVFLWWAYRLDGVGGLR